MKNRVKVSGWVVFSKKGFQGECGTVFPLI